MDVFGYESIYVCVYTNVCIYSISLPCPLKKTRSNENIAAMAIPDYMSWLLNTTLLKGTKASLEKLLIPSLGLMGIKWFTCPVSDIFL